MAQNDKTHWDTRYKERPESWAEPDDFLVSAYEKFLANVAPGRALDVAGGAGRNAVFLAQHGWQVKLMDISEVGLNLAQNKLLEATERTSAQPGAAAVHNTQMETEIVDLHAINDLGESQYDLITVF